MNGNDRYDYGGIAIQHKGVSVTTSVGSKMDDLIEGIEKKYDYTIGKIPLNHGYRPDLTSYTFYLSPKYWWLLMQYNEITDPFEQFYPGRSIKIPKVQ